MKGRNKEIDPDKLYLSPSSIITFNQCPKRWWLKYVERVEEKPTIHLIKGLAIHNVIENLFKQVKKLSEAYKIQLSKKASALLETEWKKTERLKLTKQELEKHHKDAVFIINRFINNLCDTISCYINLDKAGNPTHAFHLLKPQLSEIDFKDDNLKIRGRIDAIQKDFDNNIIIVDYKTSSKYKNTLPHDYKLQLAIYAYLYYKQEGKIPSMLCLNYLRYNESFYIITNMDLIKYAINEIKNVRNFLKDNIKNGEEFYKKSSKLCDYCSYKNICNDLGKENGCQQRLSV